MTITPENFDEEAILESEDRSRAATVFATKVSNYLRAEGVESRGRMK